MTTWGMGKYLNITTAVSEVLQVPQREHVYQEIKHEGEHLLQNFSVLASWKVPRVLVPRSWPITVFSLQSLRHVLSLMFVNKPIVSTHLKLHTRWRPKQQTDSQRMRRRCEQPCFICIFFLVLWLCLSFVYACPFLNFFFFAFCCFFFV